MNNIISEFNKSGNTQNFLSQWKDFSFYLGDIHLGFKKDRSLDDPTLNLILKNLSKIPSIQNKDILDNSIFITNFYRIFWDLISKLGIATQNFYDFIPQLVFQMNRITIQDYVTTDCHSTDKYNCGRAMMILENHKSQFLIYNTDSKGFMDVNTQLLYLNCNKVSPRVSPRSSSSSASSSPREVIDLEKYYGRMSKRIQKEIIMLKKDFEVKVLENISGVKLVLVNKRVIPKILITFDLPLDYPSAAPSGTFKDLTISEVDLDWSIQSNLKTVVDSLMYKYKNKLFPEHKELLCYLYILDY
tara:strand:+ start:209 stop:1111 length:903 start_codon:yes stop_codon:yes gene_type:complete